MAETALRRFVSDDGTRFWHIQAEGTRVTVVKGLIGEEGARLVEERTSAPQAHAAAVREITDTLSSGYVELRPGESPAVLARRMEDAIHANPDDLASYAALADFLLEQDDPRQAARGEFIRVQLALEEEGLSPKERDRLRAREAELLQAHQGDWVGEWANLAGKGGHTGRGQHDFSTPRAGFRRGLLSVATIDEMNLACARAFVTDSRTRFVRELRIGGWAWEELDEEEIGEDLSPEDAEHPAEAVFAWWPYFDRLRVFQYGWTADEDYGAECWWQCHLRGTNLHNWAYSMPNLEELYVFADDVHTEALFDEKDFTNLRVLQLYHNWEHPLETLANNAALGNLTHLLLHPKADGAWTDDPAPYIKAPGVRAVLHSPHLKSLTHLRLRMAEVGDEGCRAIVNSGILKRLKGLDLRHGTITDEGAAILAACPDLANLEVLDLIGNELSEKGAGLLQSVVPGARTEHQQSESDNKEWLMQGDYE